MQLSIQALSSLEDIWKWNARTYDAAHAQSYTEFLESKTMHLSVEYLKGKIVAERPELRYITIKRRASGHGHVAVYEVREDRIYVINFYHTSQSWQSML